MDIRGLNDKLNNVRGTLDFQNLTSKIDKVSNQIKALNETKLALNILSRMIKGEEVSDKEKTFLKAQSKDLARIIPLVAISGIPIPIPLTPLLIMLGKKYGFDFMPKDHRGLLKDDEETPPVEDK